MHQELEQATDFEMAKKGGKKIAGEFISARLRFRDVPKVNMASIEADWLKICKKVSDRALTDCQAKIDEISSKPDSPATQMKSWQDWKIVLEKFKKIDWHSQIERFQIVEPEMAASSK